MTVDNLKGNKTHLGVTLFVAFFLFLPFWACKGEELPSTRLITPDLKSDVELTNDYNSILDYEETNICIEEDTTNFQCTKSQPVIKYLFISDRSVLFEENEDHLAITKNTRSYLSPAGERTVRIYGSDAFIEVEGTWYETDFGYTTTEVWNKASTESLTYLDKWNPFKVYRVNAQETIYAGSGDGDIGADDADWATVRAMTSGETIDITDNDGNVYVDNSKYIRNCYFAFDTSSLAGSIVSASLHFTTPQANVACGDAGVEFNLIQSTATTTTGLFLTNFNQPVSWDRLSDDKVCGDLLALNAGDEFYFELNASGTAIIDQDGVTAFELTTDNNIDNSAPSAGSHIDVYYSEESGTTYDPYLEVTLESEEEPAASSTTIGLEYPENMCINNDLSIICGMTQHYESTTTEPDWVEYHYFHIPWFVWVIITTVTLWIGNRLLIEFLIRWRQ